MSSLLTSHRSRSILDAPVGVILPSLAAGVEARAVEARLASLRKMQTGAASRIASVADLKVKGSNVAEQLRLKLISLKQLASTVAMYFDPEWRIKLFARLDVMLDPDGWESDCALPSEQSFSTFLRMMIYLHPTRRPGIGLSPSGHFAAAWSRGDDRLVIECIGNDEVRWVISREIEGERESCAGKVSLHRIPDVTAPYEPEHLFSDGQQVLA